jgi:RNA polymerase sigma-70 factor (ECF subfamily)
MPTTAMMIEALIQHRKSALDSAELPPEYFWQLVERFRATLVNQAFAILGNQSDAEDVSQESLCEAFQDLGSLENPRKLGNWLRQINRRNALDVLRTRKSEHSKVERAGRDSDRREVISGGYSQVDVREVVARAIDALPEPLRDVVVLRYWEHLSYQDLSVRLDIPLGTVKSQLARADVLLERSLNNFVAVAEGQTEPAEAEQREDE